MAWLKVGKPSRMWPAGREGVRHEETADSMTACGRRIGSSHEGWLRTDEAVTCQPCLAVLSQVAAWKEEA